MREQGSINAAVVPNKVLDKPKHIQIVTSGIRIGTAAITTRHMNEKAMERIGNTIAAVLGNPEDKAVHEQTKNEVALLCKEFPLYDE